MHWTKTNFNWLYIFQIASWSAPQIEMGRWKSIFLARLSTRSFVQWSPNKGANWMTWNSVAQATFFSSLESMLALFVPPRQANIRRRASSFLLIEVVIRITWSFNKRIKKSNEMSACHPIHVIPFGPLTNWLARSNSSPLVSGHSEKPAAHETNLSRNSLNCFQSKARLHCFNSRSPELCASADHSTVPVKSRWPLAALIRDTLTPSSFMHPVM